MDILPPPTNCQCFRCVHYGKGNPGPCPAFKEGIPLDILNNEFDHSKPYPGDRGVMFEPLGGPKERTG